MRLAKKMQRFHQCMLEPGAAPEVEQQLLASAMKQNCPEFFINSLGGLQSMSKGLEENLSLQSNTLVNTLSTQVLVSILIALGTWHCLPS
jgi:hypothetical protein